MSPYEQQVFMSSGQLITLSQAAKLTPYSAEYLSLLARKGRLKAIKLGRDWMTTEQVIITYVEEQQLRQQRLLERFQCAQKKTEINNTFKESIKTLSLDRGFKEQSNLVGIS